MNCTVSPLKSPACFVSQAAPNVRLRLRPFIGQSESDSPIELTFCRVKHVNKVAPNELTNDDVNHLLFISNSYQSFVNSFQNSTFSPSQPLNNPGEGLSKLLELFNHILRTVLWQILSYMFGRIASGVQRGANGAPAPGIQGQGSIKRVKLQKLKRCN